MQKHRLQTYCLSHPDTTETLTLIHGWGAESAVWSDWAQYLAKDISIVMIDLPGFGNSAAFESLPTEQINQAWLEALSDQLPDKTHLLGWSLGGLLAQQLALRFPDRIQSLICMASTPRFIQNDGWNWAVSPPLLGDFIKMIGVEYGTVLKRFWKLQLQGSPNARELMKRLSHHMKSRKLPEYNGLLQGLYLLRDIDNRNQLEELKVPTLWLLGEHDPLIPKQLVSELSQLQPESEVQIVKDASHMPFFSHPAECAIDVLNFIKKHS